MSFIRKGAVTFLLALLPAFFLVPAQLDGAPPVNSEISRIMKERSEVEKTLRGLREQLREYQSKLGQTKRQESRSLKALENIRTQIILLEKMIAENQRYLEKLDADIGRLRKEYEGNRARYGKVSDEFRKTAISIYKYGGTRGLEHVFASASLHDALVRAQYMGCFSHAVSRDVQNLQDAAMKLRSSRAALEESFRQKAQAVREQEIQLKTYARSKKEKEIILDRLKKNKEEYSTRIEAAKLKRRQLQSRIESLIMAEQRVIEAERARRRKLLEARRLEAAGKLSIKKQVGAQKQPPRTGEAVPSEQTRPVKREKESLTMVPDQGMIDLERVSANFDRAYGSLPWPVQRGVVTRKFGTLADKELAIVTTSNGIDISVPPNTQVRAVSGGKVAQIAFLPTFGNIVIIRHPNSYLTVYANLGQLNVVKDELIKSQQLVGLAGRNPEGGAVVHFEIWKGRVKQNPENWLRR
ncbi:MAG: peptidoglycan DD-metalloendopeptidase family protein [Chlorobiaceae bacterium]|nr:peptidoglycan DD-metalloendopeptidase family protein [Chlorobiaceae bacterium]NTV59989.1 peptidoglycan DD-metalloendopeptidase family protein [Chlorobiaceae bacterium]